MILSASDHPQKSLADGAAQHCRFGSALLLFKNQDRFFKMRIAALDFFEQHGNLRVLAAKAQDRGSRNIRMMNVARQKAAKISGVFMRAAAAGFVQ